MQSMRRRPLLHNSYSNVPVLTLHSIPYTMKWLLRPQTQAEKCTRMSIYFVDIAKFATWRWEKQLHFACPQKSQMPMVIWWTHALRDTCYARAEWHLLRQS